MTVSKVVAFVPLTEEALADAHGWLDRMRVVMAAEEAARGERYGGVYGRGYIAGAQAAFDALRNFIDEGGRIGLPMGPDSLHILLPKGGNGEILSLLALRPRVWP